LTEGFKPFYTMEKLSYLNVKAKNDQYFEMAFPVVCFCDLPISLQFLHREKFGGYGIGLKKRWGIQKFLTPVVYSHTDSITSSVLKNLIENFIEENGRQMIHSNGRNYQGLNNNISYLLMFFKPYEGFRYNKETQIFDENTTRFYDEREWRYIPLNCDGLKLNLEMSDYKVDGILKEENKKIQNNNKLEFMLNDVEFLFLKKESEVDLFLSKLSSKFTLDQLEIIRKKIHFK
jgi:hypothetical protein